MHRRTTLVIFPLVGLAMGCSELDELGDLYLVKLNVDAEQVVEITDQIMGDYHIEPIHIYDSATEGFSVWLPPGIAGQVEQLEFVDEVILDEEQDHIPPGEDAEYIDIGANEIPTGIEFIGGPYDRAMDWSNFAVAVIDTGIEEGHSDLNVVAEYDLVCMSWGECAGGTDPNGHGTHVAGTIGGEADGDGVVGVAPGVPLHAVRVLDSYGSGSYTDILAGLEYVLDNPEIRVVNMSLGGPAGSDLDDEFDAALERLEDAGVVVAIAAGNESQDVDNGFPASLNRGIVVSAYDASSGYGGFAWFTNYGDQVDISAPGVSISSTYPTSDYADLDGTSMATPHVAGAAAVYMALNPNASFKSVKNAIIDAAEDGYSGQNSDHPEPLLDVSSLF